MKVIETGKHVASKKGHKHAVNPSAKPSKGKRQPVAKRKPRNSKVFAE